MTGGYVRLAVAMVAAACCVALIPSAALATSGNASTHASPDALCAAPESLARLGESTQAHALYLKALEAQPSSACAAAGIRDVNKQLRQDKLASSSEEAQAICDRASAYRHAHRDADAVDAYKAALEKEPAKKGCAAQGLNATSPKWSSRAVEWIGNALPAILVGLGVILLIGLLLLMAGYVKAIGQLFNLIPGVRYIMRGRLSLADCDDSGLGAELKVGKVVTAGIRERLQSFRDEATDPSGIGYMLDFATGDEALADIVSDSDQASSALDKLGEASEHTKAIAAIIGALIAALPIKRLAIAGVLEPAATSEQATGERFSPAAKLFMERGAKLVAATSLTGRVLAQEPAAGDYVQLAGPAAVWVQYEVSRELSGIELQPGAADSYALVREGLDYHLAARYGEAEEAFERALDRYPRNWAAYVNLAMTKARGTADYVEASLILREALEVMKRP
jgi:tetratricopeptide (TPR) repeat protein